jgi:hypothetical protein
MPTGMYFSVFAVKINKMEEKEETVVENAWALKVNQCIIPVVAGIKICAIINMYQI